MQKKDKEGEKKQKVGDKNKKKGKQEKRGKEVVKREQEENIEGLIEELMTESISFRTKKVKEEKIHIFSRKTITEHRWHYF